MVVGGGGGSGDEWCTWQWQLMARGYFDCESAKM